MNYIVKISLPWLKENILLSIISDNEENAYKDAENFVKHQFDVNWWYNYKKIKIIENL